MIGQTVGHYLIVEKIGAGGMGEVYRARDERLERDVAIKILAAGSLGDEGARKRFRKEALALSRLNHPNIATIYDFDSEGGVDFLTMEYVEGKTLSQKIADGALTEKEVISLGAQVASALEEAHGHEIVHRDLKPGNIMITPKGQVKLLDFGLAKYLRPAGGMTTADTLGETAGVAGTVPYMAPEQLQGEELNARSDFFSFGAVLYEMATGRRPFQEQTLTRLTDAILHQVPVSPRALNARVSPELERMILKCLEKDPEHRYQSAQDILADLRRLGSFGTQAAATSAPRGKFPRRMVAISAGAAATLALAALLALNVGGWRERFFARAHRVRIESLAVLPLENLSRDPEQEYFADGMTDELITDLTQISALRVISRTSVMQYKQTKKAMPQIAKELNVDAVVEGTVERAGDRVRIRAQLIEAASDRHLWAKSYERDLRDVLAMQDEVARTIAGEIQVTLTPQEQGRLGRTRTVNPEAYDDYLKGLYFWNKFTADGMQKSVEFFNRAIEKDPGYAQAYAGLSESYQLLLDFSLEPPAEAYPKSGAAARKAVELDGENSQAHSALGWQELLYDHDLSGGEQEFRRAIELNASNADAHDGLANYFALRERFDESMAEMKKARELDPLSLIISAELGKMLFYARQYDQAIEQLRATLNLDPDFPAAHYFLEKVYQAQGMYEEAYEESFKEPRRRGKASEFKDEIEKAHAKSGWKGARQKSLGMMLHERSTGRFVSAYDIAEAYLILGEKEQTLDWLQKAVDEHSSQVMFVKVDPRFDGLHSDPRFQDLLRRLGLAP